MSVYMVVATHLHHGPRHAIASGRRKGGGRHPNKAIENH